MRPFPPLVASIVAQREIKKYIMEQKRQKEREKEEIDLFLRYLWFMGQNQRRTFIEGLDDLTRGMFARIFGNQDFYNDLHTRLEEWCSEDTAFFLSPVQKAGVMFLKVCLSETGHYTELDRFLQTLFKFDDDTLKGHLLSASGNNPQGPLIEDNRVHIRFLLHDLYGDGNLNHDQRMELFLRRQLRSDTLRNLDELDKADRQLALQAAAAAAGAPPPQPIQHFGRVEAFHRLLEAFRALGVYKREGEGHETELPTSDNSEGEK